MIYSTATDAMDAAINDALSLDSNNEEMVRTLMDCNGMNRAQAEQHVARIIAQGQPDI